MNQPTHNPTHNPPEGGARQAGEMGDLTRALHAVVDADVVAERARLQAAQAGHAASPPGRSAGGGGGGSVGPQIPARHQFPKVKPHFARDVVGPIEQLVEVLEDAVRLRGEIDDLLEALTGETPPVLRRTTMPAGALLPMVARCAAEIAAIHGQISERIQRARERL